MRRWVGIALFTLFATGQVMAVSVWELSRVCGDDAKAYCEGVGYGDAMQDCLDKNYRSLSDGCRSIMDRIRDGEGVSLF